MFKREVCAQKICNVERMKELESTIVLATIYFFELLKSIGLNFVGEHTQVAAPALGRHALENLKLTTRRLF